MRRRTLLKAAAASGLLTSRAGRMLACTTHAPVHTVLLVAKCHLDVGFTLTQAKVMREYFEVYFPAAMKTAAALRAAGGGRYTWTTGSWLLYEYLEQAGAAQRRAMEAAIQAGDIAWHALPFSWQTEMLDRSMIEGGLGFSRALNERFGVRTTGAKMTDVPGHTRGIVAPLAEAGVRLLDIGVNAASTAPGVPDLFLWKEPRGSTLAVLYHRQDYGGVHVIPGTGIAVDVEVRGDNSGPHTLAEIAAIYAKLRLQFPGAEIRAATMTDVAKAVEPVRDRLPVVTGEIGDTWIYGCASDPSKVARLRALARLRRHWIGQQEFATGDKTDRDLLRRLLLAAEHTWGTDTKTYLDDEHYAPASLARVLDRPGYVVMETSWREKRDDIDAGVASLPPALRQQAEAEFEHLRGAVPDLAGMKPHPSATLETKHFSLGWDAATGALIRVRQKATGTEWASREHPLLLFTYQTLSSAQYADYMARYLTIETEWGPKDFGKPGIDACGARAREWQARVVQAHSSAGGLEERLVLELAMPDADEEARRNVAWPGGIFFDLRFPRAEPYIDLTVSTLNKLPNRLPEAMWLTFLPNGVEPASWQVEKAGQMVAAMDVVPGGGRAMHAVSDQVCGMRANGEAFRVRTRDAAVVGFGERSPLSFSMERPEFPRGMHICLYNNAWGTNYPQWCGGDWAYRFRLLGE